MKILKLIYKVVRSVLFSAVIAVAALYLLIYVALSIPIIQSKIKGIAETELSAFLGGPLSIERLNFYPFNEVVLSGVTLRAPDASQPCISAETIGAGINLWKLITRQKIEITYAELISPDVKLSQATPQSKLNIQFLIDALSPKDKTKPPTKFDLRINNVVIRKGDFSFDKLWMKASDGNRFDPNHISVSGINADVNIPQLKNDDFIIDLRRLALTSGPLEITRITTKIHLTATSLSVNNLAITLPGTDIRPADFSLEFSDLKSIGSALLSGRHELVLVDSKITPSDFRFFYPPLADFSHPIFADIEIEGNTNDLKIAQFKLKDAENVFKVDIEGEVHNLSKFQNLEASLSRLQFKSSQKGIALISGFIPGIKKNVADIITRAGDVEINTIGKFNLTKKALNAEGFISTSCGELNFNADVNLSKTKGAPLLLAGNLYTDNFALGTLLGNKVVGGLAISSEFNLAIKGKDTEGTLIADLPYLQLNNSNLKDIHIDFDKSSNHVKAILQAADEAAMVDIDAEAMLAGSDSQWDLQATMENVFPGKFVALPSLGNYTFSGQLNASASGNNINNITGNLTLDKLQASGGKYGDISLNNLSLSADYTDNLRTYELASDWIDASIKGDFLPSTVIPTLTEILSMALPEYVKAPSSFTPTPGNAEFYISISKDIPFFDQLHIPVRWLTDLELSGSYQGDPALLSLHTSLPYLKQGTDKLIRDTSLRVSLNGESHLANVSFGTLYPTKKGDLRIDADITACDGIVSLNTDFNKDRNTSFYGQLMLDASMSKDVIDGSPTAWLHIYPSSFFLNKAEWKLGECRIDYVKDALSISDFHLHHDNQFLVINGNAGKSPDDRLDIHLADIDLDYIFDTLNINYVQFGGLATGSLYATDVFSPNPKAEVDKLFVKNLAYNGTVLGDGDLFASWNNSEMCVEMGALISEENERRALMKGGIWVTRDSLSFDFDANKVNVGFLQPFMSAFAEKVEGRASGRALLYGTFKDIDMRGRLKADTLALKLGFTNVTYSGSDSVIINPGRIEIPGFKLYDRNGHSALLRGELTHRYFHEPSFNFRLTDARHFLCYDTNEKINPDWYGTIFGSGTASVTGRPGVVNFQANMTTEKNSSFTFVLSDRQNADDYKFLTFSDHRKEKIATPETDSVPDFVKEFYKKVQQQQAGPPTIFNMDIRADVTPDASLCIVMDPTAGDKIRAKGAGSMNISYSTESDEMKMYGRYTLEEGTYNFSLQDLILKDFNIRPGSSITFNGDPLDAALHITAAYRVNTNLTDLDKSFADDKELNRTNVPLDALLKVDGELQHPNVSFDIDLPTLTEETVRKVKSIISTEDMMSRQIIYLLALNRFYTPEYMGSSSNGGEWASVASSTISSQLTNILGQLTDKVNVMPSLRSEKGDFSDVEVDVALSSRLLNNRLLLNGNFGYRDRTTSNTTFVGDFDIEYLLNAKGNLRLKAYNHFNDQNYYLKSALTTQGIGVVYRREFDNPFTFLRPKRNKKKLTLPSDSSSHSVDTIR